MIDAMCTHCGRCCENELFFLTDVEAPIVAQKLNQKGGLELVMKHVRHHPRPFNKYGRFLYYFNDHCPFHDGNRCEIHTDRPMSCRLFPIKLLAFIDNNRRETRQPAFDYHGTKTEYECSNICQQVIDRINTIGKQSPMFATKSTEYLAASLLDKNGLAYCFGQRRARGNDFFNPGQGNIGIAIEIIGLLAEKYIEIHGVTGNDWRTEPETEPLPVEMAEQLISDRTGRKASTKTSKRLKNAQEYHPDIFEWLELARGSR